ncbi:MAG: DUF423 domain-containing protein [Gammaproteobacteria bacterium]|nr:DUF423 domain-containing protein [Gammaproteobacteria bacterium]
MLIFIGAVLGFLGVAAGAFGAHALRDRLGPDAVVVYGTAADYHMLHAVAVTLVGVLALQFPHSGGLRLAGLLLASGTLVFSGSLYVLAISGIRALGAITPIGGLLLLAGWLILAITALNLGKQ